MGYRSDVTYIIECASIEEKEKFVALAMLNDTYKKALDECKQVKEKNTYIICEFSDVKWYEDYEEVKCHTKLLQYIDELDDTNVNARFVRIGEDSDDIEETAYGPNGWDIELYVSRVIDHPYQ
jgi:hypothetical protein